MRITPIVPVVRRAVARRPWIQWIVIAGVAVAVAGTVGDAMAGVDAERAAWGETTTVWVAATDLRAGDRLVAERRVVPVAVAPAGAAGEPGEALVRHAIGRGEIVSTLDLVTEASGLAHPDWLVAPIRESPPSGAELGERVQVVSDGYVLADDGVVVGFHEDVTLVAVEPDAAPLLPAAAETTRIALLRHP